MNANPLLSFFVGFRYSFPYSIPSLVCFRSLALSFASVISPFPPHPLRPLVHYLFSIWDPIHIHSTSIPNFDFSLYHYPIIIYYVFATRATKYIDTKMNFKDIVLYVYKNLSVEYAKEYLMLTRFKKPTQKATHTRLRTQGKSRFLLFQQYGEVKMN